MSAQHVVRKGENRRGRAFRKIPLAVAVALAFAAPAWAQDANPPSPGKDAAAKDKDKDTRTLGTVTVTAQKREENLQKVPISLQVLGSSQLEQQDVASFSDYAKLIPSLSYGTAGGGVFSGPGFVQVYMRGVASGGDGNHSGSQPSVGMYLDEQPITTIQGALDIHMYDIDRVEALAGPQGTLYGASSQAGTVRIITKKPDPSGYAAGFAVEASAIDGGGIGHVLEGFVNLPMNNNTAAVRLVGWQKHDAGWVDNLHGTRTYPTSGITADNAAFAKNNYNTADTAGLRAAMRFNIADRWTITPQLIAQKMKAHGSAGIDPLVGSASAGYDSSYGKTAVKHFYPEFSDDRWYQAAMTVEGKVGNFDLTYVFSHLKRDVDSAADYSDYGYWYDALAGYGAYFYDDSGNLINPAQHITARDGYKRTSHELRIASPQDNRLRLVAGLFWQNQSHDILQNYQIDGLASVLSVSGWPDTIWLTRQNRSDDDRAVFGQLSYDLTDRLEANVGGRWFHAQNALKGYFGFAEGYSSQSSQAPADRYGEAGCYAQYGAPSNWQPYKGAPCLVFDKGVKENGSIYRANLTFKINDTKLLYATWSEGYRPGGINRRGTLPPYKSDFLTNYEAGWKTSWGNGSFIFNGAVFREDWKDFQFSYLSRPERPDRDPQRQPGAHQRPGDRPGLGGHLQPADHRQLRLVRRQADPELLRLAAPGWQAGDGVPGGHPGPERQRGQRPAGRGRHPAADHAALQGQPQRALHLRPRPRRGVLAGLVLTRGQAPGGHAHRRDRAAGLPGCVHPGRSLGRLAQGQLGDRRVPEERVQFARADDPLRRMRGTDLRLRAVHRDRAAAHPGHPLQPRVLSRGTGTPGTVPGHAQGGPPAALRVIATASFRVQMRRRDQRAAGASRTGSGTLHRSIWPAGWV